jgi:Fe-S cluster assembly iron-binding protein IscA
MVKVMFDEKEKQYKNRQPVEYWKDKENEGLIIENGEITGFEK